MYSYSKNVFNIETFSSVYLPCIKEKLNEEANHENWKHHNNYNITLKNISYFGSLIGEKRLFKFIKVFTACWAQQNGPV